MTKTADDWDRFHRALARDGGDNPALAWRRRQILHHLALDTRTEARILDVGCGTGDLLALMAREFPAASLIGSDDSAVAIELATKNAPTARVLRANFMAEDFRPDPGVRDWATHAVCSEVLEHVDDPIVFLRGAATMLAPGGRLVVTVPGGPMSASDRHFGHQRHYTRNLIGRHLRESGFVVESIYAAGFPFHNLYRLVVMARGKAAIADQTVTRGPVTTVMIGSAFRAFATLFRLNLNWLPLGWQIFSIARKPETIAPETLLGRPAPRP